MSSRRMTHDKVLDRKLLDCMLMFVVIDADFVAVFDVVDVVITVTGNDFCCCRICRCKNDVDVHVVRNY